MMMRLFVAGLIFISVINSPAVYAQDEYNDPQMYAQDKLVNAQAQYQRLKNQKEALEKLMGAVKKDLKAAKLRAKAETVQKIADTARQDASVNVEQAGIAVDLPDLMSTKGVQAVAAGSANKEKENIDLMFRDRNKQESANVFFPAGSGSRTINPEYIK